MSTYRRLIGSVHAVAIDGPAYTFGLILPEADFAFFDHRSSTPELPSNLLAAPVLFRVAVHKSALSKGRWPKVGKLDVPVEMLQPIPRFMRDALKPGEYSIYLGGSIKPASRQQCIGLECMAVWDPEHVESRLSDHYAGKANVWVEQLALGEA